MIKKSGIKFDTIAVSGVSGMMFGSPLSLSMRKKIAVVRKGESTHSTLKVEATSEINGWIFVDDLISTCDTFRWVFKAIQGDPNHLHTQKFLGAYIYEYSFTGEGRFYTAEEFDRSFARSDDNWVPKPPMAPMTITAVPLVVSAVQENKVEPEITPKILSEIEIKTMKNDFMPYSAKRTGTFSLPICGAYYIRTKSKTFS
jgi:hypothetical protein